MFLRPLIGSVAALSLASVVGISPYAASAQGQPSISVVNLQVQQRSDGTQMVVTPRGQLVMLPGAGVNGNVLQLYMGANGGFWYTDRKGQTEDITAYVDQIRKQNVAASQTLSQQVAPPQYAPYPTYAMNQSYPSSQGYPAQVAPSNQGFPSNQGYPPNQGYPSNQDHQASQGNQDANYQQGNAQSSSSSSSGGSGIGTAMAAGMGAMAGSALGNMAYYNNVPYGTPMYYNNNRPYYNNGEGHGVFVDDGEVQWNHVAAANNIQNTRQQQKIDQAKSYQAQRAAVQAQNAPYQQQSAQPQQEQQRQRQQFDQEQGQRFQQQQNWYQEQRKDSGRATAWQQQSAGENPFVRQSDRGDRQAGGSERSFGGGQTASGGERSFGSGERSGAREFGGGRSGGGGREFGGGRRAGGGRRGR